MNLSINTAYSKPVRFNSAAKSRNVSFGDFRHCEVNYKTEKMTPETKELLEKAKDVYEKSQKKLESSVKEFYQNLECDKSIAIQYDRLIPRNHVLKSIPAPLKGYSFSPTYEALMENGKAERAYSIDAGIDTNTFPVVAAGDEIGMWKREYDYMYNNYWTYDLNKDVQHRLKQIIEVHSKDAKQG